jgi:hypothetical protein
MLLTRQGNLYVEIRVIFITFYEVGCSKGSQPKMKLTTIFEQWLFPNEIFFFIDSLCFITFQDLLKEQHIFNSERGN